MEITIIQRGTNHYNLELGISQERTNIMLEEAHSILDKEYYNTEMTTGELMQRVISIGTNDNEQALMLFKLGELMGYMKAKAEESRNPIERILNELRKQ